MKPHVVFISEKWCDCRPEMGLTNSFHNLFGSLESTDLASYSNIFFDEWNIKYGQKCDEEVLKQGLEADLVVVTPLNGIHHLPNLQTFGKIKDAGVPVVAIHFDSISPKNLAYADSMLPQINFNVVLDSGISYSNSLHSNRYVPLWTPQDPRIFYNPNKERDIAISHLGTTEGRPERENSLNFIGSRDIKVYSRGGQRKDNIPIEEYADILQRSLITLNWCENSSFKQLKGRIFEAMLCGACLFESENEEIKKYFVENEDYVSFKGRNSEALAHMLRSYVDDRKEIERIAKNGYKKATANYNAENFWQTIFRKAGVNGYRHIDTDFKEAVAETALAN